MRGAEPGRKTTQQLNRRGMTCIHAEEVCTRPSWYRLAAHERANALTSHRPASAACMCAPRWVPLCRRWQEVMLAPGSAYQKLTILCPALRSSESVRSAGMCCGGFRQTGSSECSAWRCGCRGCADLGRGCQRRCCHQVRLSLSPPSLCTRCLTFPHLCGFRRHRLQLWLQASL